MEHPFILEFIVLLVAAVLCVPIFQRLGLGPVLGYFVAGLAVGPFLLGIVEEGAITHVLAELGVAFLLFTVGLELPIERLRVIPRSSFGLAAAQVVVTAAVIAGIALLTGASGAADVLIGGALALSSTAVVLQLLTSRGVLATRFGRLAFTILVMQDLAVGPLIILVFSLGGDPDRLLIDLPLALGKAAVAVVAILWVGRWLLVRIYRFAGARNLDVFVALTLLVILAIALATRLAGLSAEFGAFLAGMLLAGTPYRHQVEAEIQPFRTLLLGLFFMTIGMSIDVELAWRELHIVVGLALALMVVKAALLTGLARLFGVGPGQALRLGLLLSQAGEFAFVLLTLGMGAGFITPESGQILLLVTALTMMATPPLEPLSLRIGRRVEAAAFARQDDGELEKVSDHVVICGFGRVGRASARELMEAGMNFVAVDFDLERVSRARELGGRGYFGDATRAEVLAAVGVDRARAVIVALDNPRQSLQLVMLLRYIFPTLKIYARAYDAEAARELEAAGVTSVVHEVVATGRQLASAIVPRGGRAEPSLPRGIDSASEAKGDG